MATAKISVIPKTFTDRTSLEFALQSRGMTRSPGTGVLLFPYKEADGTHRTALDENNSIIRNIEDSELKAAKQKATKDLRERLEKKAGIPLGGKANFYRYGYQERADGQLVNNITVEPYKLIDGDNLFDLDNVWEAVTFYWLSVHPRVASSYEAYQAGQYPSDTQFYVKDDQREAEVIYAKKKTANDAIIKFNSWSPEKKKKISRLCGLPAFDDSREEIVYNMMDEFLKSKDIIMGAYKGQDPLRVFSQYADLDDNSIYIKDLIDQAFTNQIYRIRNSRVFEGEQEVYKSKEEMLDFLMLPKNQDEVLAIDKKLKTKKLANA